MKTCNDLSGNQPLSQTIAPAAAVLADPFGARPELTQLDWNYFGNLPRGEHELFSMCVWEYARECLPLRDNITALRKLVGEYCGLTDPDKIARATYDRVRKAIPLVDEKASLKWLVAQNPGRVRRSKTLKKRDVGIFVERWDEFRRAIDEIAGRFDWSFLCSAQFPEEPWLQPEPECAIKARGALFRKSPLHSGENQEMKVPYGRKERVRVIPNLPKLFRFQGDMRDHAARGDVTVFNQLNEEIDEVMRGRAERNAPAFHCFVVPDEYFDLHDPADLAASFRSTCLLLDRRRLIPNDTLVGSFTRRTAKDSLKWLGTMRFFHFFNGEDREEELTDLGRQGTEAARTARYHLTGKSAREMCDRAADTYRRIFNVPEGAEPLNYKGRS